LGKRKTTAEFIEDAKKVHGDLYDYSKVEYLGNKKKVIMSCKVHGEFEQVPSSHLSKRGCSMCGSIRTSEKLSSSINEFIEKANQIHKCIYDYSQVKYINAHTKVIIICKIHGKFEQTPNSHLQKVGCPKCGIENISQNNRFTTKEFIEKAKKVHQDIYNYLRVKYINNATKVKIICREHGEFEQTPANHLQGVGCPVCSGNKQLTTEEFILKAKKVHGDLYGYSKVEYINAKIKVIIICKKHGEFKQQPTSHLNQNGCSICGGKNKLTTKEFIRKANKIHNHKYNYSKVEYINAHTKVQIICKKHGTFEQISAKHLSKRGCPICSGNIQLTTEEFLIKVKQKKFNIQYDYSKTEYINSKTKLQIICIEHNISFKQIPYNHLKGQRGCPKCQKLYKGEEKIRTYLDDRDIFSECQKSFDGLKYINALSCDFYLKDKNTIIEFDGVQHYQSVEHFGGNKAFYETQKRDIEKNLFAEKVRKTLLRIIDKSELNESGKIELEKQKEIYKNSEFVEFIILNNLDELNSILDKKLNISKDKIKKAEKSGQSHFEF